jgi:hypothetical protein
MKRGSEATAAALNHPNIVHIHGLEKADGTLSMAMERLEGRADTPSVFPEDKRLLCLNNDDRKHYCHHAVTLAPVLSPGSAPSLFDSAD